LTAACGDAGGPAVVSGELPATFRLLGSADSTLADGRTIRCQFAISVTRGAETQRTGAFVRYVAIHDGSAGRTVSDTGDGSFSFVADVQGPQTVARFFPPDSVELLLADTTDHASRFWRAIAFLGGRVAAGDSATWTCAPFDINAGGLVDTSGVVLGRWRLEK
jgi:hypothetical protein